MILALPPLLTDLREAGGDHTDRLRSAVERLLDRGEHVSLREADDHQVRRFGELAHGAVSADPGDRFARPVHGVDDAGELGLDDVAEEPAADGVPPPRGAEDGNARWGEEGSKRGGGCEVVPSIDAVEVRGGRRDREADLELGAFQPSRDLETRFFEHLQHRPVLSEDVGDEPLDAGFGRPLGETLQQPRADPPALMLVGDRERHFCGLGVPESHEDGVGDGLALELSDQ